MKKSALAMLCLAAGALSGAAEKKKLQRILLNGLTRTHENVIRQFVAARPGEAITAQEAEELRVQLERLRFSNVTPEGFFQSGYESTLDLERGIAFTGESLHVVSSASALHARISRFQFLSILFSFQYSAYPRQLEQRLGGWQGTRTLPALLIPADRFAVTAVNYQIALLTFPWATFAALAFVDAGTAAHERGRPIYFWGPGAGMRMYLSEITVPALGIDAARDMLTQHWQISFFFGYNLQ